MRKTADRIAKDWRNMRKTCAAILRANAEIHKIKHCFKWFQINVLPQKRTFFSNFRKPETHRKAFKRIAAMLFVWHLFVTLISLFP